MKEKQINQAFFSEDSLPKCGYQISMPFAIDLDRKFNKIFDVMHFWLKPSVFHANTIPKGILLQHTMFLMDFVDEYWVFVKNIIWKKVEEIEEKILEMLIICFISAVKVIYSSSVL